MWCGLQGLFCPRIPCGVELMLAHETHGGDALADAAAEVRAQAGCGVAILEIVFDVAEHGGLHCDADIDWHLYCGGGGVIHYGKRILRDAVEHKEIFRAAVRFSEQEACQPYHVWQPYPVWHCRPGTGVASSGPGTGVASNFGVLGCLSLSLSTT
jgi:hypothetical protein